MYPEAFINKENVLKHNYYLSHRENLYGFSHPIGWIPPSFHADDSEVQNVGLGLVCVGKM